MAISCLSTDFISRGPGILFLHDFSGTFHGAVVQTLVLSQAKFVDKIFVTRFISYEIVEIAFKRNMFVHVLEDCDCLVGAFFSENLRHLKMCDYVLY